MPTSDDLAHVSTAQLIATLLGREAELFDANNRLTPDAFELRKTLGVATCVDGIPWRVNESKKIELMALRRSTGPYPGKLVLIGGTILLGESLREALSRHFRDDFGVAIDIADDPFTASQYRKEAPDAEGEWLQDPGKKHVVAPVYLVTIKHGTPSHSTGCDPVEWITLEQLNEMDNDEFGYSVHSLYHKAFRTLLK